MKAKRQNGCGTISKVKGHKSKPFRAMTPAVYSSEQLNSKGNVKTIRRCLGYFATEKEAQLALANYLNKPFDIAEKPTFADIFDLWLEKKRKAGKSAVTIGSYVAAFRRCGYIADMEIEKIRLKELITVFEENADGGKSTVNNIKIVIDGVFEYAERFDKISRNYARLIQSDDLQYTAPTEDKHKIFTDEEIQAVLKAPRDIVTDITVILLYTGFRVNELLEMTKENVFLDDLYLRGGKKTAAGKNRIVPIHTDINQLLTEYYINAKGDRLFNIRTDIYRDELKARFGHLPHDTRHTFISRLQSLRVDHVCIERLAGHTSKGITDSVYTHKDIEELRQTIQRLNYLDSSTGAERVRIKTKA